MAYTSFETSTHSLVQVWLFFYICYYLITGEHTWLLCFACYTALDDVSASCKGSYLMQHNIFLIFVITSFVFMPFLNGGDYMLTGLYSQPFNHRYGL